MKGNRCLIFTIFLFFALLSTSTVHAQILTYPFVVWDGKVYEVSEVVLLDEKIGNVIGKVNTKPNDSSGDYYGNASNTFAIGTKYYEISGVSMADAIAVENERGQFIQADYVQKATEQPMSVLQKGIVNASIFAILIIILGVRYGLKRSKTREIN
ncbi:hypothetical protein MKZ08_08775 [Viridibacillus sp. FSL R5-0477]|uniref:Uncharacterized protein n=1 Tax=Viridibacillus arenosi FSL R5-213 TaxID=1227360 RepID=W4EWB0_9BACL|nr:MULTISPECIES: hypothetical protein [Viridibacillus]ETT84116.1 hypothetical protein C176_12148 [Viridibacillus arenosi FSL R5-213]OMC79298.1 hypothetical protein BK130_19130 [Viridibacillus sp. FSL H8-0123]OMC86433.1 hypothetical protein BK128_10185 [Viridibacillus sp. FSL H7-0596]OMC90085.1 hypothetical protein BK137_15195 [Viridibacillus arenosi]